MYSRCSHPSGSKHCLRRYQSHPKPSRSLGGATGGYHRGAGRDGRIAQVGQIWVMLVVCLTNYNKGFFEDTTTNYNYN